MHITHVVKRDGKLEEFNPDKLNKWAEWASKIGVDWSSIALSAYKKCNNKCSTDDLHEAMISACIDMETEEHLYMAGNLLIGKVLKQAFGGRESIPTVKDMYHKMSSAGLWDKMNYTDEEFDKIEKIIKHDRDYKMLYSKMKQIFDKYVISDKKKGIIKETPQFVYIRMAMGLAQSRPKETRIKDLEKWYNYFSKDKINAPSPNLINLGTPKRHYASCCVYTTDDSASSLAAGDHIAYMMTCASAGIGAHIKTRSVGDRVRHGMIKHLGKLPYYKVTQAAVSANLQANRGGACTMHWNVLDPETEDLIKLLNVQTVAEKRIKDIHYSFGYNPFFVEKAAKNEQWMLVSYGDAPELYELMYDPDIEKFKEEYISVEKNKRIHKKFVSAREILVAVLTEGVGTGKYYEHNTTEMNRHTPFLDTIYSSNLCAEIGLPTSGYRSVEDLYKQDEAIVGEIGLCNLAAICAGNVSDKEYEDVVYYALLMIDTVIEIMDYPFPHLGFTAKNRRSAGVGITNLAHDMASRGLKYSSLEGKQYIHRLAEMHSFYLHKASLRLAKEYGIAPWMDKTKYPSGWLPIDTANKFIDTLVNEPLHMDWESLRAEIISTGGIRNSVLEAMMPCESSSVASGTTNGPYPIRESVVYKTSGINKIPFIAPDWSILQDDYEFAWDIPMKDMAEVYGIIQKFTGQAISADFYIDFGKREDRSYGTKEMLNDFIYRMKCGLKTRYYINSRTGTTLSTLEGNDDKEDGCSSGACKM